MTSIEWTDETWNPVRGCSIVSEGCRNCYAMKQANRFSGEGMPYEGLTELGPQGPRWTGKITLVPEVLDAPLSWKKPRRIFVNSMSDLFHEDVPDEFIDRVFEAICACRGRHTFQILTKRPDRMLAWCQRAQRQYPGWFRPSDGVMDLWGVWLGVSVEDQKTADERTPILLQTPAAVRFVSAEPLLGPVSFRWACWDDWKDGNGARRPKVNHLDGLRKLDWVIVGGESGPGARPCDIGWIRSIVEQCKAAAVPCFVKQLGAEPIEDVVVRGVEQPRTWFHFEDKKGGDPAEWPADLRVREFPR